MPDKIVIVYDCPYKQCDKLWLKQELETRGYRVKALFAACRISNVEQRGKLGKIAARGITFWQSIKGLLNSKKGDTVICWSQWSGLFLNVLPGAGKRNIISYNWLTPVPNMKTRFLYAKALQNQNLTIIINSPETKEKIHQCYQTEDIGNIVYIPDVFDNNEEFLQPLYAREEKYCFSGGRANRDWRMLIRIAEICPHINFKFVAVKADWDKHITLPENVQIFFDLEPEEYYELLYNSYMSIYPLREERVSGLINILKSIQLGKPVLTTRVSFTEMYFPEEYRNCLLPFGDIAVWKEEILKIWDYSKKQYCGQVAETQAYIKETFSPCIAGEKLDKIMKQFRCRQ